MIPLGNKAFCFVFLTKLVCAQRAPKKWNLSSQTRQASSCCALFVKDFSRLSVKWGGKARNVMTPPENLRSPNRGWSTTRKMRACPPALRPHTRWKLLPLWRDPPNLRKAPRVAISWPEACASLHPQALCSISFFYYGNILALQCCISFCCIAEWISHVYTYFLSLLDLSRPHPPPRSSHSPEPSSLFDTELPTSCLTHSTAYVPILISQFINPSYPPLPPLCPQVHSLCLCLYSSLGNRFICTIFSIFHVYTLVYHICFSDFIPYDRL